MEEKNSESKELKELAEHYHKKFPGIDYNDHFKIIKAALDEKRPIWTLEGFTQWYDEVGEKLQDRHDLLGEIMKNPHFVLYRESMILGSDWDEEPILKRIETIPVGQILEHRIGDETKEFYYTYN